MTLTAVKSQIKFISAQDLMIKLIQEPVYLVDVREVDEYNFGHISTAILKPSSQFKAEEWLDKNNIILYCRSGKRSHDVAEKLIDLGISNVTELQDGIMAWQQANFPLTK